MRRSASAGAAGVGGAVLVAVVVCLQLSCMSPDHEVVFEHPAESTYGVNQRQLRYGGVLIEVDAANVTEEFFAVLDQPAWLGRTFLARDFSSTAEPVVILNHQFWNDHLGKKPEIMGRALALDDLTHTVVGVMGPGVEWPPEIDLWTAQQAK